LIPTGRCEVGIAPKWKLNDKFSEVTFESETKTLTKILAALQNTKKFTRKCRNGLSEKREIRGAQINENCPQ
jgi:hypothetical protein